MIQYKKIDDGLRKRVAVEVKLMLAAHRDRLWARFAAGRGPNPADVAVDPTDAYYGEAFGVMRGLVVAGYGYFGSNNLDAVQEGRSSDPRANLKWWFGRLESELLAEDGFADFAASAEKTVATLDAYRRASAHVGRGCQGARRR